MLLYIIPHKKSNYQSSTKIYDEDFFFSSSNYLKWEKSSILENQKVKNRSFKWMEYVANRIRFSHTISIYAHVHCNTITVSNRIELKINKRKKLFGI